MGQAHGDIEMQVFGWHRVQVYSDGIHEDCASSVSADGIGDSAETEWHSVVLSCRLVVIRVSHGFGGGLPVGPVLVLGLLLVAH